MENQELFVNANAWAECEGSVTFRNATQKQEHYMQFHPEIQTLSKNDKGMKKADKEKACNLCTKKFTSVTDLFNHQKYHRCRFHAVCIYECQEGRQLHMRLEIDGVDALSCGCAIRRTHQLPCAHEIAEYRDRGVPIPLDVADTHYDEKKRQVQMKLDELMNPSSTTLVETK
ncbi:hypothetical protein L3X38_010275 [Prunus dulcis]|uniref:C2H2-type domain-containing protein n=1 Tax=Prunus dulcis TaxID=3755 RepID=A0AAD4ZDV7_PRUDU|nr:hypothetical protein L3X38_010275 [Prunus dulcis]